MSQFVFIAVIVLATYLIIFLPQQRKTRELNNMLNALEVGDEVYLNSGIHGFVSDLDGQIAWVEVAQGVELKISRSAVAGVLGDDTADEES